MTTLAFILATTLFIQQDQSANSRDSLHSEPVILEVRVGSVASTVVAAHRIGDVALLPVEPVLALAELRMAVGPHEYLPVDSLATILHAAIVVDWDELIAMIADDGRLPVSRRAARERQRALLNSVRQDPLAPPPITRRVQLLPRSVIVDYDATASGVAAIDQPNIHLGVGINVLGGALGLDVLRSARHRPEISAWYWDRESSGARFVRYARLGRISSVRGSVIGTGFLLSSEPTIRESDTPRMLLAGTPGRDWDVEAYRDGLLVYSGQTDSAGSYAISVPTLRGSNSLTVAAYGPAGERRSATRYVLISDNTLPAHVGAYDVAVGRCMDSGCDYAAESTVRYAPIASITAGAGLRIGTVGLRRSGFEPSLLLSTHLHDDLNTSLRYAYNALNADMRYNPSPAFGASLTYAGTRTASMSTMLPARYSSTTASAIWRLPATGYAASATLALAGYRLTDTRRLYLAMSLPLGPLFLRPSVDVARQVTVASTSFGRGLYAESSTPSLLPIGSRVRARYTTTGTGDNYVTLAIPFTHSGQFEIGAEWTANSPSPRLTMSMNMITRAVRYDARSTGGVNGAPAHSLSGSLMIVPGARTAALSSGQLRGRASITGLLFVDANDNGVRDTGEPLLPGVSVLVGDIQVETDSAGAYELSDVVPYAAIVLSVDSLTLPSLDLVVQAVRVTPPPNGVTRVDIPVTTRRPSCLLPDRGSGICGLADDAQRCDPPPIHCDDLKASAGDSNPVADSRKPPQPREHIPAECRPVPVRDLQVVIRPGID